MPVFVKNYSELFLSVRFPYSQENIEKIRKVSGRRWIQSDKIWCIPDNKESIETLVSIFGKDKVVLCDGQIKCSMEKVISAAENELKLKKYSLKTKKAYLGHMRRFLNYCNKQLNDINKDDITRYLLKQIDEEKSSTYVDQAISAFKIFIC